MKVNAIPGYGTSHYNVEKITGAEMETLCTLKHRADDVCASMENKEKKTEYFTKEECNLLRAVLHKFTEGCEVKRFNSFLEFLEEEKDITSLAKCKNDILNLNGEKKPQTPRNEADSRMQRTFEAMAEKGVE